MIIEDPPTHHECYKYGLILGGLMGFYIGVIGSIFVVIILLR